MPRRHLPLAVALVALASCRGPARAPAARPAPVRAVVALEKRADSVVADALHGPAGAGASVVVMRGDAVLLAKGWGLADADARTVPDADTVYRIGSITKQFTAVAIVKLAAAGKLSLGDDVTRYVAAPALAGKGVTLRHLLSHTSGVHNYTDLPEWDAMQNRPMRRDELVAAFTGVPLDFPPGTAWRYSNSGYYLLGLVIEKASGMAYADFIRKQVTGPAGIDIGYCAEPALREATGYTVKKGERAPADPLDMAHPYAAGGLCASARELARWTRALATGQAVTAEEWQQMTTPATLADGSVTSYGFGLAIGEVAGHRVIGHDGGINGFGSHQAYYPDDGVIVVVLVNSDGGGAHAVGVQLARAALGVAEAKDLPISAAQAAPFVGSYDFPAIGLVLDVRWSGDVLESAPRRPDGHGRWAKLRWQGGSAFYVSEAEAAVVFRVDGAQAVEVTLTQGGESNTGRRVP